MNYSPSSRDAIDEHCREVIRSCLNIVEQHGDTYVAIHKDDDIECIVLVSMIRSYLWCQVRPVRCRQESHWRVCDGSGWLHLH